MIARSDTTEELRRRLHRVHHQMSLCNQMMSKQTGQSQAPPSVRQNTDVTKGEVDKRNGRSNSVPDAKCSPGALSQMQAVATDERIRNFKKRAEQLKSDPRRSVSPLRIVQDILKACRSPSKRRAPAKPVRKYLSKSRQPSRNVKSATNMETSELDTSIWSEESQPPIVFKPNGKTIDQVVSETVTEALVSCELSSTDCSVTHVNETILDGCGETDQINPHANPSQKMDELSIQCKTLSELSTICVLPDREHTIREQYSSSQLVVGPLHSSMRYPQSSTPSKQSDIPSDITIVDSSVSRKLAFEDNTLVHPCTVMPSCNQNTDVLEHMEREELKPKSATIDVDLSTLPSLGLTMAERTITKEQHTQMACDSVDSDATTFLKAPLAQRAVTYKIKGARKAAIKRQLRGLGKQIRTLGADKLKVETLAVL